jgi:peptidoglycan/LPS O-acetylase OafA/YrhL
MKHTKKMNISTPIKTTGSPINHQRVNEIDLLRFIAAMMVVFYHYAFRGYAADNMTSMPYLSIAPLAKYGYLGVELFFMISGFVILMTASNGNLKKFFVSRVTRLYPAFWICCTLTFIATLLLGNGHFSATPSQYLINMTMLGEFINVPSIDGAYWSLFVEMRFYALIAILMYFNKIAKVETYLIGWLAISVLFEIVPVYKLRYIFLVDYSAYFIAGATLYLIWSKSLSPSRTAVLTASWGLAIYQALQSLAKFQTTYKSTLDMATVIVIITLFFVILFMVSTRKTGVLGNGSWTVLGVITYPLYLIHQNIGFMLFNWMHPQLNVHLIFWGTLMAMLFISYLIHSLFEKRIAKTVKIRLDKLLS